LEEAIRYRGQAKDVNIDGISIFSLLSRLKKSIQ